MVSSSKHFHKDFIFLNFTFLLNLIFKFHFSQTHSLMPPYTVSRFKNI